jgi:hypothetical protein
MTSEVARGASNNADSEIQGGWQQYRPSWVDRFTAWVDGRPGPNWAYYSGIGLFLFLLQTAVVSAVGAYPVGSFLAPQAFIASMWPFFLAFMHHLDDRAASALMTLRPALRVDDGEYGRLEYQLTTMPARPTLLASLTGVAFVVLVTEIFGNPETIEALDGAPVAQTIIYLVYVGVWGIFSPFVYHTIRQLGMFNLIYTTHTRIDLFRMRPLYAFSSHTAITAASLTLTTYSWYFLNPGMLRDPVALGIGVPITLLGLAIFIWPLVGIHRLLVDEKEKLLEEGSRRLEDAIADLHGRVDSGELEGMTDLNMAIGALEMEHQALSRIPTWPWQPETLRLLATALVLPLVLLLAQVAIQFLARL